MAKKKTRTYYNLHEGDADRREVVGSYTDDDGVEQTRSGVMVYNSEDSRWYLAFWHSPEGSATTYAFSKHIEEVEE